MKEKFEDLIKVMKKLRKECLWDRKQTFETLVPYTLEEAQEIAEAVEKKDWENLKEELGDVLYHVLFYSEIAEEKELFDIKDVMEEVREKLVRRHPHVFGNVKVDGVEEILENWKKIKEEEKRNKINKKKQK